YMPIPPAPTEPHTLSLHDALPISWRVSGDGEVDLDGDLHVHLTDRDLGGDRRRAGTGVADWRPARSRHVADPDDLAEPHTRRRRSEEHTSELQSPYDLVCRPLLEK